MTIDTKAGILGTHPTCARPDGTAWCGHLDFRPLIGGSWLSKHPYCKRFRFYTPERFYCPDNTALTGEDKKEET